jgi:hypothetical protein
MKDAKQTILIDYNYALIHLMWIVNSETEKEANKRELIFGLVELYPSEITDLSEIQEQEEKINSPYNCRIYYIRKKVKIDYAMQWYKKCLNENIVSLFEKDKTFKIYEHVEKPRYPFFSIAQNSQNIPFISKIWGTVRCHHLMSIKVNDKITNLLKNNKALDFTKNYLFWDISSYPEYHGSIHLILPNPVYRKLSMRLIPEHLKEGDKLCIDIIPRLDKKLSDLRIYHIESVHGELLGGQFKDISETQTILPFCGVADKTSCVIYCQKRGLLDYSPMNSFIRTISSSLNIIEKQRIIKIRDKTKNTEESYKTDVVKNISQNINKSTKDIPELCHSKNFINYKLQRKRIEAGNEYGQTFFYNAPNEAKFFIRNLISNSKEQIIIIDPYFSGMELVKFVCAISMENVKIKIVTSGAHLKEKISQNSPKEEWEILQEHKKLIPNNIEINVMIGTAVIHDRYLIIDGEVWFSGNSLHTIGQRASTIIKLPNPYDVIEKLNEIFKTNKIKNFVNWAESRKKQKRY